MLERRDVLDQRLKLFLYGAIASLLVLFCGLYYHQVIQADKYVRLAYNNRLRVIRHVAPRGEIFDRNGVPLAVNEKTFSIMGYPVDLNTPGMLQHFSELLSRHGIPVSVEDLERTIRRQRGAAYRVIRLVPNLTMVQMAELVANPEFPRQLFPLPVWRRIYPAGAIAAHIVGYVGEISESQLRASPPGEYVMGDFIGQSGLERFYESILRGVTGQEAIEVNARGRRVGTVDMRHAQRGQDLHLTVNMGAQRLAAEILQGHVGSIVVMDVNTGAVIVSASSPTYDSNPFAWGVSAREWNEIINDRDRPMLDRSIAGLYAPASTFKILVALAALEENLITPRTTFVCTGGLVTPTRTFHCHRRRGHGRQTLIAALQNSCNYYFYQLGLRLGIERLLRWSRKFGVGAPTGIDLPGESSGTAAGPEWKRARFNEPWFQGDTINYSIGQGFLLMTPLQIARMYAAFANGGYLVTPHLVAENAQEPMYLGIAPGNLNLVHRGLDYAVIRGTGSRAGAFGVRIAGKTGTAQVSRGLSNALFAAYAPADAPRYVAIAMIEGGEFGGRIASPMVGQILAHILSHPSE